MPCAGWNSAAVTAGAAGELAPLGLPLPAVGSVGPTSDALPAEFEQPAIAIAAAKTTAAAVSLFMRALLGKLLLYQFGLRRTWGADGVVGYAWRPKGGKQEPVGANSVKEEKSGSTRASSRANDAGVGAQASRGSSRVLRIVGGRHRGRRVRFPAGVDIRPTPDRVRETLFNWLQPRIADARVLDLFAGSGALGIEALSRGAAHVTFVERDRRAAGAIDALLKEW